MTVEPMISLQQLLVGSIILMMVISVLVEIYVKRDEKKEKEKMERNGESKVRIVQVRDRDAN